MIAYWFRLMEEGKPNGYVGMAVAYNMRGVFWQIDQYCDPFAVEVKSVQSGGFCTREGVGWSESNEAFYSGRTEFETAEQMPFSWEKKWRKPSWVVNQEHPVNALCYQCRSWSRRHERHV